MSLRGDVWAISSLRGAVCALPKHHLLVK
jgi:hypothetical protein